MPDQTHLTTDELPAIPVAALTTTASTQKSLRRDLDTLRNIIAMDLPSDQIQLSFVDRKDKPKPDPAAAGVPKEIVKMNVKVSRRTGDLSGLMDSLNVGDNDDLDKDNLLDLLG